MLGVDELYTYRGNTERKMPPDQLEGGNQNSQQEEDTELSYQRSLD